MNMTEPAVRKDFWELLISRHPIEENFAKSTRRAYRWRSLLKERLVIVQYVSEYEVGVFLRGERDANPDRVEDRLRPYEAQLKQQLAVKTFFIERGRRKCFFPKKKQFESSRRSNWEEMADWLHGEANRHAATVRQAFGS